MTGAGDVAPSGMYTVASSWISFVVVAVVSPLVAPEAAAGTGMSVLCVVKVPPWAANRAQQEINKKHPQRFMAPPIIGIVIII